MPDGIAGDIGRCHNTSSVHRPWSGVDSARWRCRHPPLPCRRSRPMPSSWSNQIERERGPCQSDSKRQCVPRRTTAAEGSSRSEGWSWHAGSRTANHGYAGRMACTEERRRPFGVTILGQHDCRVARNINRKPGAAGSLYPGCRDAEDDARSGQRVSRASEEVEVAPRRPSPRASPHRDSRGGWNSPLWMRHQARLTPGLASQTRSCGTGSGILPHG